MPARPQDMQRGRNYPDDLACMRWVMHHDAKDDWCEAQRRWRRMMDEDFKTFTARKQAAEDSRVRRVAKRKAASQAERPVVDEFDERDFKVQ